MDNLHPDSTTGAQYLSDLRRIASQYGDLDAGWAQDGLESVMASLEYSAVDERNGESNPSRLVINGSAYKSLASYRSTLRKYQTFCAERDRGAQSSPVQDPLSFKYEQDLQTALVACVGQIEPGLGMVDGGKEYIVSTGRIDMLARDASGLPVVIELKAVTARRDVLGQIAGYMADIQDEMGVAPRGILIAPDFDAKLTVAARMIPTLTLMRYTFSFDFQALP